MSPTKRPSTVTGLRRGVAAPERTATPAELADEAARADRAPVPSWSNAPDPLARPPKVKDHRVTLNLPPELYRQLARWADEAAETISVPRVGVQDAMRAMIRVITSGEARSCSARVMAELRGELRP